MRDEARMSEISAAGSLCRALVPVTQTRAAPASRPMISFVAHMLACDGRSRAFRRAYRVTAPVGVKRYAKAPASPPSFEREI